MRLAIHALPTAPGGGLTNLCGLLRGFHALADAHDLLTRTSWTGANLSELVTVALSSHSAAEEARAAGPRPAGGRRRRSRA